MTARAPSRPCMAAALLLAVCAAGARGQAPAAGPEAPWVQIEVVLFRTLDPNLSGGETWPEPRGLAYPDPLRVLIEPGTPEHAAALAAREFDAVLAAEENTAATSDAPPPALPFVLLPSADTALAAAAARLAASGRHRLLAHVAWRQPLPEAGRPVRVLLTAGQRTGEHHELEGYLSLARSRYLHADARLWLNDFPAAGSAAGSIALPAIPLPRSAAPASVPDIATAAMPVREATPQLPLDGTDDAIAVEPLLSTRTVVLEASRRLLPGEIHYLDHPLFGALLAARPWDPAGVAPGSGADLPAPPPEGAEETPPP